MKIRPSKAWWICFFLAIFVTAGVWSARATKNKLPELAKSEQITTATVERKDFVRNLRLHGTVEAVEAYNVTTPQLTIAVTGGAGAGAPESDFEGRGGDIGKPLIVTKLVHSGTLVKRGAMLIEFDRQAQLKNSLDRLAEYRDLEEQIKKKQAEHTAKRAKDESELKQAENKVGTATLDMRKNEVVSKIDAEKNRLTLEESKANLKQLQETMELKQRAAQAELRILEIQRDRARNALSFTKKNAERMVIRAPIDGLAVLSTVWKNGRMGEIQEGEEVRPGSPILQVVNPSIMQVRVRLNQVDLGYLSVGQTAKVILDAYPDNTFLAKLERMAPIGIKSNFSQKMYTFVCLFSVQGANPRLIPDLSAAVDVEVERRPSVVVVPKDTIGSENGQYFVRAKNGSGFEKRFVKIGDMSDMEVVIESGLKVGMSVSRNTASLDEGFSR